MYNLENKICGFNVNEFHLVTMLMPYIYEVVNEGKKVITFFEKDVEEIYKKVLNINSVYWKNKEKLNTVDWKKINIDKLSEKFSDVNDNDVIVIAGKKNFIEKINTLVLNFHTNFTLVNCYEIDDFNENLENIIKSYSKILCTNGIREIKELYLI